MAIEHGAQLFKIKRPLFYFTNPKDKLLQKESIEDRKYCVERNRCSCLHYKKNGSFESKITIFLFEILKKLTELSVSFILHFC